MELRLLETDSIDESVYYRRKSDNLSKTGRRYSLIDLFSGAGGLTLGFTGAFGHVFEPVWANDLDQSSAETYERNFGTHCVNEDILKVTAHRSDEIPEADVVIGGPPCQGFSLLNKNRLGDKRKELWRPFLDTVELSKAKVFLMENVPQLLGSLEHQDIVKCANKMGFQLRWAKLCAADYGVAQLRWRAFIVGSRIGDPSSAFPPKRTHYDSNLALQGGMANNGNVFVKDPTPWATVRDVISNLPKPRGTEITADSPPLNLHFGRKPTAKSLMRYRTIPCEGMNRFDLQRIAPELTPECWIKKKSGGTDLFGRLWWDRPAFTIRTEFFKPEKGRYLHPKQHRPITHREAARLQSFPDFFKFCGTKIEIARQIGNAVPPLLAARLADCVYALLEQNNSKS